MHDVFISYSHNDAEIREAVCQRLESEGIRCWYAPRDIRPGNEWADAITNALKQCRAMILIFTDRSNNSNQVLREVGLAVDFKKQIIPCRCDETFPSGSMQYYLSTLHWLDLSGDREKGLDELTARTRSCLAGSDGPAYDPPVPTSRKNRRPGYLIPVITAAILVLLTGLFLLLRSQDVIRGGDGPAPEVTETAEIDDVPGTRSVRFNDRQYVFSPGEDSPGADDYLYALLDDNTIRLDKYADTGEKEITLPEVIDGLPVIEVGASCFEDNLTIEKVTLPPTILYIDNDAFAGCTNLHEIVFSDILAEISPEGFAESGLIDVALPDSVTEIGNGIFFGCTQLESVFLPAGIDLVPIAAFTRTENLKQVTVAAGKVLIDVEAFDDESNITLYGVPGSYTEKYAAQKGLSFASYEP